MSDRRPLVVLGQLPIPPEGQSPIEGNVPLAAGYLKLYARRRGLEESFQIEVLPARQFNRLSQRAIVADILDRDPQIAGFTCYLWNVERTLWIAERLKQARPDLKIVLGGPEVTADNPSVLDHPAVDYAAIGEGEQTFAELLAALRDGRSPAGIAGLWTRAERVAPPQRRPLARLDGISSPYLEGILDAADERLLWLETARGCSYQCAFCYYPKSYDKLYFLSREKIVANLEHAARRGAKEVFLLDPTLNQRPDFEDFLRLLAEGNRDRQFTYSAELRAEGIDAATAQLLREANFAEVEVGLQSIDRDAQELMHRRVNLDRFERGARALLDAGIRVRIDLILGLPGDTVDSVRRGIDFLHTRFPDCELQVFNLSILPGTSFRSRAKELGLHYQTRPPYYVLRTPTLSPDQIVALAEEAQAAFGVEFDLGLEKRGPHYFSGGTEAVSDAVFHVVRLGKAGDAVRRVHGAVRENPHDTFLVVLDCTAGIGAIDRQLLAALQQACYQSASYLDFYYSLHPNQGRGAKRLVVLASYADRQRLGRAWIAMVGEYATLAWRGAPAEAEAAFDDHEATWDG
jgi:hypothetical protein